MSAPVNNIIITRYKSPCGEIVIGVYDHKICICDWTFNGRSQQTCTRLKQLLKVGITEGESNEARLAAVQLDEYFSGQRHIFNLPTATYGTAFQETVWRSLSEIDYGEVKSYADIAKRIGQGNAVRAVASAIGANRLSIIIPCHRVIGKNGSLTGYAGGLEAKRYLLALEKQQ